MNRFRLQECRLNLVNASGEAGSKCSLKFKLKVQKKNRLKDCPQTGSLAFIILTLELPLSFELRQARAPYLSSSDR
jgi:hypothetical protein